jgi:hypothetical protein
MKYHSNPANKLVMTTVAYTAKKNRALPGIAHASWQRIVLLIILGYEAAGCLLGGSLLIIAPNGRLMDMPVEIMNGVFSDFFVPGIILFLLGILNTAAFISTLRRKENDWIMIGLALGGLAIWFIVEIVILDELHWLHLMWGFPVFIGIIVAISFIALRYGAAMTRALLLCGILSSLWYIAINLFVPVMYEGYSLLSFTVSELSAIGAPTRVPWVLLTLPYTLLFACFGWGVLLAFPRRWPLRVAAVLMIMYSIINFYWPPMHQRAVIAAGGGTLTDSLHLTWSMMTLILMMLIMGFGAADLGKGFRRYTLVTWVVFILFGVLTFVESGGIEANLPTPRIGL